MLSPFEDELIIVGEGEIDDSEEEEHVENLCFKYQWSPLDL